MKAAIKFFYRNTPYTEANVVNSFLNKSENLKHIREAANKTQIKNNSASDNKLQDILNNINNALSFNDLLNATNDLEALNKNDGSIAQAFGNFAVKAVLFVASYGNDEASFGHYLIKFREEIIDYMSKHGYKGEVNSFAHSIHQMRD